MGELCFSLTQRGLPLSMQEKNMFALAFKSAVNVRRKAWRSLAGSVYDLEMAKTRSEDHSSESAKAVTASESKPGAGLDSVLHLFEAVGDELRVLGRQVVDLLHGQLLILREDDVVYRIFYLKMMADHRRYLSELEDLHLHDEEEQQQEETEKEEKENRVLPPKTTTTHKEEEKTEQRVDQKQRAKARVEKNDRDEARQQAEQSVNNYAEALELAKAHLLPLDPLRLAIALNYSVCAVDILRSQKLAHAIAQEALIGADSALRSTEVLHEVTSDSTMILSLLQNNVETWENS